MSTPQTAPNGYLKTSQTADKSSGSFSTSLQPKGFGSVDRWVGRAQIAQGWWRVRVAPGAPKERFDNNIRSPRHERSNTMGTR